MTMFKANQSANLKNTEYAVAADFCQIFDQDMSSLYLLSLLLTAEHEKAERCFVGGLETAVSRNRVFKEWARSWARRAIIQNALRIVSPRPNGGNGSWDPVSIDSSDTTPSERVEIAAVLGLQTFDRFVFVMSVLEGYSDHDCAILLGSARRDVLAARSRALKQIGSVVELFREQQVGHGSHEPVAHDRPSSVLEAAA
jgi:hypothetical protein